MPHDPITVTFSREEAETLDLLLCEKTGASRRLTPALALELGVQQLVQLAKKENQVPALVHVQEKLRHAIDT